MNGRQIAPIERVTIPLVPRTCTGCCDLAVMYYGRYGGPLARLYLTIALAAVVFVYAMGRFVGGGPALVAAVLIVCSKPLGLLTVAALWRTTFGQRFDWHALEKGRPKSRGRVITESLLSIGAGMGFLGIAAAVLDDEWGAGWLVRFGPQTASTVVIVATLLMLVRVAYVHQRDYRPSRSLRRLFWQETGLRVIYAVPAVLAYFAGVAPLTILMFMFWLPLCLLLVASRSFKAEAVALADIDPDLLGAERQKRQKNVDYFGPGFMISVYGLFLIVLFIVGTDTIIRTLGGSGPVLEPFIESASSGFFGLGTALASIIYNPAFGAVVVAAALFVYQILRIAWFFVFLDARVRYDCWDMELRLAREAQRLESP